MISTRPTRQLTLDFGNDGSTSHCGVGGELVKEPQGGQSCAAVAEKSAWDSLSMNLMEQVVDSENMERAWKKVKANRGAPGPDGITLKQFPEYFRPLWPELRQQLLDGTYRPEAVRRKVISKPDGGERLLGIPNVQERLIQQAILQVLTPIFDPEFSESSFGFSTPAFRTRSRQASQTLHQTRLPLRREYGPVEILRPSSTRRLNELRCPQGA